MAVKQLPKLSELPEPPDRLVGDQERFDVMIFDSLKAQKKMVNDDLNKGLIPKLNEFAVDVNASVNAAAQSERNAAASATTAGNKANEAASSAATAATKAGEASKSAVAAKTSETNAAASKSAAAKSATDAAAAQRGAEAARDEAQNLANVGYASASKAGLAKVDGKTTQADAGGMITVKDVAIGGNAADLASARGQIGTPPIQSFTKTSADDAATLNLNDDKWWVNGEYSLYLRGGSSSGGFSFTPDVNNTPITVSNNYCVRMKAVSLYNNGSAAQEFSIGINGVYLRKFYRTKFRNSNGTIMYYPWKEDILQTSIGDGILFTNGKISVPMATPTTAGLVHGDGTTVVTDNGVTYAKDIAIGGDAGDLASKRGQIGTPVPFVLTKTSATDSATLNLNDEKWWTEGQYTLYLRGHTASGYAFTPEVNNVPVVIDYNYSARLKVAIVYGTNDYTTNGFQCFELVSTGTRTRKFTRVRHTRIDVSSGTAVTTYYPWQEVLTTNSIGDGIYETNGIISVPEYSGATASAPGKSGLVPPAKAGAQELFLTGGGSYKSAITKITDSVTSAASDTAASAKAVKAAYDKAMAASLIAPGDFVFSYKASKTGFLLCNGAAVSRTTYANLFAAIGTKFGAGDGSTTFNLPDARNRVLQGASGNLGAVLAAGLPNITGALNRMRNHAECGSSTQTATGAFAQESCISGSAAGGEWQSHRNYSFNASRSNAIYGKSSTVQPPALALNCFIKY